MSEENVELVRDFLEAALRNSGVELENDTAVVFTVRDRRVARIQGYMDQDAALKAAGLLD